MLYFYKVMYVGLIVIFFFDVKKLKNTAWNQTLT